MSIDHATRYLDTLRGDGRLWSRITALAVDAIVEQAAEAGYECSAAQMRRALVDAGVDPDALSEADLAALSGGNGPRLGGGGPITAGGDADTIDAGPGLPTAQTQGPIGTGRTDRQG